MQHRVDEPHIFLKISRAQTSYVLPFSGIHGPNDNGLNFHYLSTVCVSGVDTEYLLQGG